MTNRFNMYQTARLAFVVGLMALAPSLASAQPRCTALNGIYAFTFSGTFPGSTPIPFNGVGVETFQGSEGSGTFTGTESANFNGSIVRDGPISGTYTLNPDCTGTMIAKFPDGSTGPGSAFVVANEGKTIYMIGLNPGGGTLSVTFTRI